MAGEVARRLGLHPSKVIELRSCLCNRPIHNYAVSPGNGDRIQERACCRCLEDCLCHGGGVGNWGAVVEIDP